MKDFEGVISLTVELLKDNGIILSEVEDDENEGAIQFLTNKEIIDIDQIDEVFRLTSKTSLIFGKRYVAGYNNSEPSLDEILILEAEDIETQIRGLLFEYMLNGRFDQSNVQSIIEKEK